MLDIAIIGAGLSGLYLAERLAHQPKEIAIFEARDRCGGRILSQSTDDSALAYDLGPTWIWPQQQPHIQALVYHLGLTLQQQWDSGYCLYQADTNAPFQRYVDQATHASARRLKGGCQQLIDGLLLNLSNTPIHLQHNLVGLKDHSTHIDLEFLHAGQITLIQAKQVVLCLPPRLLAEHVTFDPALSPKLLDAMQDTVTWMAGHAKAVLIFQHAFWRSLGYSGNAMLPHAGAVLAEIYDACQDDTEQAALFGFFGLPAFTRTIYRQQLESMVVNQIKQMFGADTPEPLQVIIQDWSQEAFTATDDDQISPLQHPSYGLAALQLDHWQDKLYFCGTETAAQDGGYLEGALIAAERVFKQLTI